METLFSVHALYSLLGAFSILCALFVAVFKKNKRRMHWFIILAMALWGLRMGFYAALFNPSTCYHVWIWPSYLILSMAYGPLFYLFATELSDIKGVTKTSYLVFIPMAAITATLLFAYGLTSPDTMQRIHNSAILGMDTIGPDEEAYMIGEYFCYYIFRSLTFWLEAGILIWSAWCISQYEKTVNDYFSSHEGKSINQAKTIAYLTAAIVIVVLLRDSVPHYEQHLSLPKFILMTVSFLFQLFLTIMAFNLNYTAEDIRRMLEADDRSLGNVNTSGNSDEKGHDVITCCWIRLQEMMRSDKVFLDPDLNLIDLASKVGTNRTYLSQAIKQFSGSSFSDYINHARIEFAKQLLLEGNTLKDIEASCGYRSTSTFYNQFQKQAGMAPKVWLEEQLSK